ncbi:hypothetical protein DC007_14775, partial [Enterococcus faecalis]
RPLTLRQESPPKLPSNRSAPNSQTREPAKASQAFRPIVQPLTLRQESPPKLPSNRSAPNSQTGERLCEQGGYRLQTLRQKSPP